METIMKQPPVPAFSRSSTDHTHPAARHLSRIGAAVIAALALGACAFLSSAPAAAATSERATVCLSSDSQSDCGFASLAQCEATAAGGLGVCDMVSAIPEEHSAFARSRAQMRSGVLPRR
jgi:Protein of unknown function (DUF3551)